MTAADNSNEISEERDLQSAIYDDPSILDEAWPEGESPSWAFICREKSIPIDSIPQHDLSLDLLFVDEDAQPTLVETKLSSNIEIRRTIVGQLLEYAAHVKNCDVNELRHNYEDPDDAHFRVLTDIRSLETYASVDDFWQQLRENLDNSRMTLLFAADDFPQETKTTAAFLDAMTKDNLSIRICAPSGINFSSTRSSRPAQQRPAIHAEERTLSESISVEDRSSSATADVELVPLADLRYCRRSRGTMTPEHLSSLLPEEAHDALHRILSAAHHAGACLKPRSQSLIICVDTLAWREPKSPLINIGWLDPPRSSSHSWGQAGTFTFGYAGDIFGDGRLPGDQLYAALEQFAANIASIGQPTPLWENSTKTRAHSVLYHHAVAHIDELCEYLMKAIATIRELSPEEPNGTRPVLELVPAPRTGTNQQGLGEALLEALREANSQNESTER